MQCPHSGFDASINANINTRLAYQSGQVHGCQALLSRLCLPQPTLMNFITHSKNTSSNNTKHECAQFNHFCGDFVLNKV